MTPRSPSLPGLCWEGLLTWDQVVFFFQPQHSLHVLPAGREEPPCCGGPGRAGRRASLASSSTWVVPFSTCSSPPAVGLVLVRGSWDVPTSLHVNIWLVFPHLSSYHLPK